MKTKRFILISLLAIAAFFVLTSEMTTCGGKDQGDPANYYEDCTPIVDFSADKVSVYPAIGLITSSPATWVRKKKSITTGSFGFKL